MNRTDLPYRGGGFHVTASFLSTPRQVFALRDIDHVECRRPILLIVAPAALTGSAIVARFADLMTWTEIATALAITGLATLASAEIAVLRLRSLSIRNEAIWGRYSRLRDVRMAIQVAMETRAGGQLASMPQQALPADSTSTNH